MDVSPQALATFILEHCEELLRDWEQVAGAVHAETLSRPLLRDDVHRVLGDLAARLETGGYEAEPRQRKGAGDGSAVSDHVLQRVRVGSTMIALVAELHALEETVVASWPARSAPGAHETLDAFRRTVDAVVLASIERFERVRMTLLEGVDTILRGYPGESTEETLRAILGVLVDVIEGVDTAAVLLADGDVLRVRAAHGLEAELDAGVAMRVGEGFAGRVAERGAPVSLHRASESAIVVSPVIRERGVRTLYGVPLRRGEMLLGVAHIGTLHAEDFSDEAKALFRSFVDRIAGVVYQELLREQLDLERARYSAVVENAPTVIFSKDLHGRYLTINRSALAPLGLAPEQLVGRTDDDVFPDEIARALRAGDRDVVESRETLQREEQVPDARGSLRTYLTIKFPVLDAHERVVAVGGVSTDVTERRRRELGQSLLADVGAMLAESLDETSLEGAARRVLPVLGDCTIVDALYQDGSIRRVAAHHRDPAKAELSRRLLELPLDRSRPHLVETVLRTHETVAMTELRSTWLDGVSQGDEHRRLLAELDPTSMIQIPLLARGRLLGAWVFLRCGASPAFDPIDVELAEELGRRASLQIDNARLFLAAERARAAREEILGVVAHDLRGPLSALALAADILEQHCADLSEPARLGVESVARSVAKMQTMVSDLLDQHALDLGRLSVAPAACLAIELAREAVDSLGDRAAARGCALELDVSALPDERAMVAADAGRVQQVFENLIGNSLKFTAPGGRVTVRLERTESEVCFVVSDTGSGIPPELLPRLFEPYWQAERGDRRGVGLGLAISKGIVEAHGGRIGARSEPGAGATIFFTLPAVTGAR